ncbi:hypothetical protein ERJ75_001380700 [Trypanosoma vivax]|nr:hypothetical protein ERJ75_001380700 [Trypanosoma vivax]
MKRFWTSLLGFASLLALLSANKAQGGAAKGVKRSSAQGACSFATALDAVARAAELAATEAAERSHNASQWQEQLATALSKHNNEQALKALGTAANMQSMNAKVGAVAVRLAREEAQWAVDIRSAVFAFSALSGGGEQAALCISKENDGNETADFSRQGTEYAFDAICGTKPAAVEALAKEMLERGDGALFARQDGLLPNLTSAVIATEVDRPIKQPDSTETGITTGDDANEGQACPLVVYRSKGTKHKHGGIIAGNGGNARPLIWDAGGKSNQQTTAKTQTTTGQRTRTETPKSPSTTTQQRRGQT